MKNALRIIQEVDDDDRGDAGKVASIAPIAADIGSEDDASTSIDGKRRSWWAALFVWFRTWRARRRDRRTLMSLNDRQLRDIGLNRHDLPYRDEQKY
ncbi:DUF1127 domain-containing protein [Acerihabitans sp. KWT182]|uniref:DUF1127 domain-containing protein n=1 Tax=Acerihabitans sp. KWT182 TaxID=3157919 RepID=A0AAU7Q8C4_9GAMM